MAQINKSVRREDLVKKILGQGVNIETCYSSFMYVSGDDNLRRLAADGIVANWL